VCKQRPRRSASFEPRFASAYMFNIYCCVQRTIPPIHQNLSRTSMTNRPSVSILFIYPKGVPFKKSLRLLKINTFLPFPTDFTVRLSRSAGRVPSPMRWIRLRRPTVALLRSSHDLLLFPSRLKQPSSEKIATC